MRAKLAPSPQIQKIIAREFLLLWLGVVVALLIVGYTALTNIYWHRRVKVITWDKEDSFKQTDLLTDSLRRYSLGIMNVDSIPEDYLNVDKAKELYDLALKDYKMPPFEYAKDRMRLNKNRKALYDAIKKDLYGESFDDYQIGLLENYVTDDIRMALNKESDNQKKLMEQIADAETRIAPFEIQVNIGLYSFLILLIIIFPGRYLFYAIRWSIRTLKE